MRGGVRGPSRSPAAAPGGAPVLRECDVCGTRCVAKRCGRCGRRSYCGVRCQREDWASHRVACGVAPAAACAVCARGGTTTAPPCGHGLCAAGCRGIRDPLLLIRSMIQSVSYIL